MHSRAKLSAQVAGGAGSGSSTDAGQADSSKKRSGAFSIIPMLDKFHDIIGGIHVPVDDGVDKLNRKYTLLVFLFLALPIFTKQYIGEPIECFAPVYFAEHQSRYINSYCWTQSTYYMVPVGDPEDDGDQQEPPDRITPDEVDYFIGFETVAHIGNERVRRVRVNYYQWAPLILLAQGLCFYIPFLIWNSCANNAGVKLRRLLKKASDIASLPPGCQQREALLAEFVDQFHTLVTGEAGWCADLQCGGSGSAAGSNPASTISGSSGASSQAQPQTGQPTGRTGGAGGGHGRGGGHADEQANGRAGEHHAGRGRGNNHGGGGGGAGCCLVSIPIIGNLLACCLKPCASFGLVGPSKYLCLLYLAVKSAYVVNVGLQFFLLGQFLGRGYLKHGIELLNRLIVNGEWWASPRFPLSTLCQVRADMSGGLRSYTCQCVLPINVFNEKIFSVVWFYMAFLLPLNVLSLLFWIYRTFETNRLSYIRLCLWRTRLVELNQIHRTVRRLSQSYLGWDGVFLLRLIEHNHGSIMATLIMSRLWEFYANQMKLQEDANQLALASNAQHTLSQTTTAISNQHQIMMAAAAVAAQQQQHQHQHQQHQQQQQPNNHHNQHSNHSHPAMHGSGHAHGPHGLHGHAHPPIMQGPGGGGGGGVAHAHSHGAPIHPAAFAAGGHGQPLAPMVPHGPHGHHAGQISQAGGHQPLHAANTHHAHHPPPPHLNAFANATSASLLAQLQHQHQQQQHAHQVGAGSVSAQQAQANQQSAAGNVAAAVAALAAAAAANSSSASGGSAQANPAAAAAAAAVGGPSMAAASKLAGNASSLLLAGAHKAQQQQQLVGANNSPIHQQTQPLPPVKPIHLQQQQQQHHQSAALEAAKGSQVSSAIHSQQQQATNSNHQASSSSTKQQQQVVVGSGSPAIAPPAHTTTTSFITAPTSANGQQAQQPGAGTSGGPPLPPPPPAHVVAAVAAATQQPGSLSAPGPGSASAAARVAATPPSQPASNGLLAALRSVGAASSAGSTPTTTTNQQQAIGTSIGGTSGALGGAGSASNGHPAPPPHTNPVLFNLRSSNIQASAAANRSKFSPHTMKRT